MADAKRDANRITDLLAKSNADSTLIELLADAVTSRLLVNATITGSIQVAGLVPETYDYISLSYTGSNLTGVVFKTGGSGGTTVATLTLAYDGSNNLTSVTRS